MQFNHLNKAFLASAYGKEQYEYYVQNDEILFHHASAISSMSAELKLATTWRGYFGPRLEGSIAKFGEVLGGYSRFCAGLGISYEMMRLDPISDQLAGYEVSRFQKIIYGQQLAILPMPSSAEIYLNLIKPECQRNIRRGQERYFSEVVEPIETQKLISAFQVYESTMKHVKANPKWSLSLQRFKDLAFSPGFTILMISNKSREPVAMAGLLQSGTTIGSLLIGNNLTQNAKYATDFLYHSIVLHAIDHIKGATHINFGGGRTLSPVDSLLKFKMKFTLDLVTPSKYLGIIHSPEIFAKLTLHDNTDYEEPYVKILKQAFTAQ